MNLVNVVYHEGLYRQSREGKILPGQVYKGLELRLEKFANELMTFFSQSFANTVFSICGLAKFGAKLRETLIVLGATTQLSKMFGLATIDKL